MGGAAAAAAGLAGAAGAGCSKARVLLRELKKSEPEAMTKKSVRARPRRIPRVDQMLAPSEDCS
jgi:hypothetical protein